MKKRIYLLSGLLSFGLIVILSSLASPESYEKDLARIDQINEQYREITCRNSGAMVFSPKKNGKQDYFWASGTYWKCENDEEVSNEDIDYVYDLLIRRRVAKEDALAMDIHNQLDDHLSQFN